MLTGILNILVDKRKAEILLKEVTNNKLSCKSNL